MTGKFHANRQVCSAFEQQLCYRKTPIPKLGHGVEDWGLPTDGSFINRRAHINVRPAIQKEPGRFRISELRSHVQQCRALQQQATAGCAATVKFRESPRSRSNF